MSRFSKSLRSSLPGLVPFVLTIACSQEPAETPPESSAPEAGAAAEPASPETFPEVVATVNGTEIHKEELFERVASIDAQARGAIETSSLEFYRSALEDLVGAELLYQESQAKGLETDGEEVDRRIDSLKSRLPEGASFEQALEAEGLTLDGLRERIQRDMSIQALIETSIASRVEVTDAEMRQFYDENPERMRLPERRRVSHILKRVPGDASPEAKEAAREAIGEIRAEAAGGADFAALAREHSDDPGSASNGGELVITRGQTVPPFEEAAFALEPGGLSNVVETQFGFHIIKLSETMEGRVIPFDEARERIEQFLRQEQLQEEVQKTVESLKQTAQVEVFI